MKNKDRGFTLIELLAVIIILAIIAIIAIPLITDLINRSRYGAFGASKRNIEHAAELYYARNAASVIWDNDISYVEIGTLKEKKFLGANITNLLTGMEISDDTKVLLYREGRKISYSLQLYNDIFFDWYQKEMIKASKENNTNLPINIGDKETVDLEVLMNKGLVDELRLPLELENRCVGYVEIEKIAANDYEYNAYVDCLTGASVFASHYVSYGGKYLDEFNNVIETSDGGYLAVGRSNSEVITKYGFGNNGKYDAIIVKFDSQGNVLWGENFGGSNNDLFNNVIEVSDGYIAVGKTSSSDGDLTGLYRGGYNDGLIVKYNKQGEIITKKSYGSSGGIEDFRDIIQTTGGYIVVGSIDADAYDGDLIDASGLVRSSEGIIIKFDQNFNTVWRRFFVGTNAELFHSVIETTDNGYIVSGISESNDYDMTGIGWTTPSYQHEAIIVKYNNNGNLLLKRSFKGSKTDIFTDIIEVSDGYIAAGYSNSCDQDMMGICKIDNGNTDSIIVKYDKNLSNIIWKKSFGGSATDGFTQILKKNDNEIFVVGNSKSTDMDMNGIAISSEGYKNAIIVKYNASNGNIVNKKVFGGSNSDSFNSIIQTTSNGFMVAGTTFSNDNDLKNFNKGHSDGILVSYDDQLNLQENMKEPVVIIDKLKTIIPNYGSSINNKYNNIYTSNDPTIDSEGWCTSVIGIENSSNYTYGYCLNPYNGDDIKTLTATEVASGLRVYQGERHYNISVNANNNYNWHSVDIHLSGSTGTITLSNLKLKFADGYIGSINSAVNNGYIQPLVIVHNAIIDTRISGLFPTVMSIINDGGSVGTADWPQLGIKFKPKKSQFTGIILTSSKDSFNHDGMRIDELRNFDMSITPTQ